MKRVSQRPSLIINSDQNLYIPTHDEVQFKDIQKYLDIQMQDNIKKKLDDINEEMENLGKVCDKLYKKSSEEYKTIINKEREDLDNKVKNYIFNLKDNLIGMKDKLNYDYKGKFLEINGKLNVLSDKINIGTKQCIKLKNQINYLNEDCSFLKQQMDDIKDMNIYLKYKLKLFLGEIQEEPSNDKKEADITKLPSEEKIKDNNIKSNNIQEKKIETEKIINENNTKDKDSNKNEYEDKLYLTATKNFKSSPHKKKYIKNNEFDEVEYLKSKLNLEEVQLINYIQHEKEKNTKLNQIYASLYLKTQNPHFSFLKELIDQYNLNNKSKSYDFNTSNESNIINTNNKSGMQSMQSIKSTSLSNSVSIGDKRQFYTPENPGYGFINRKENKEIILNFLESVEAKKIIYKIMYGD